jgi:hypothetical protein
MYTNSFFFFFNFMLNKDCLVIVVFSHSTRTEDQGEDLHRAGHSEFLLQNPQWNTSDGLQLWVGPVPNFFHHQFTSIFNRVVMISTNLNWLKNSWVGLPPFLTGPSWFLQIWLDLGMLEGLWGPVLCSSVVVLTWTKCWIWNFNL